jgi:hypothetical protein
MAERSQVHDMLDASFTGGINDGLALGQHRHGVAGKSSRFQASPLAPTLEAGNPRPTNCHSAELAKTGQAPLPN